jgi:bacterioferritin
MASQELIDGLNHALNRELGTFVRYMLQAASIKGAQWESVRTLYQAEAPDEVGHAQYLTETIVRLGGTPKVAPDLTPPPSDVREMLRNDIEEEMADVSHYLKLADWAGRDGLVELKLKMEEQAADEDRHRQEMERLLG